MAQALRANKAAIFLDIDQFALFEIDKCGRLNRNE